MGVVPVDLGAPEVRSPAGPGRSFVTMLEDISRGGSGEMEGLPEGERSQRGRLLEHGVQRVRPGVPRR